MLCSVSFADKTAAVLAILTVDPSCRDVLLSIGRSWLVGWLIEHATDAQGSIKQEKSEDTLINLLKNRKDVQSSTY